MKALYERAQSREMEARFVFTGSGFFTDEQTGKQVYRAEDGDLICVANFNSAMIDVASASGAGNDSLLFEAFTDRIPPVETEVLIELVPVWPENK